MKTFDWCGTEWMPCASYGTFHTGQTWQWYDADQVWLGKDGIMLKVENNPMEIEIDGGLYHPQVAAGMIRSVEAFGYGIFSAEIKLPKGRNLWPAFWLVGDGKWPNNGEIDIVEAWSGKCNYFKLGKPQFPYIIPLCYWDTTTNVHWHNTYREYVDGDGHCDAGSQRLPLVYSLKNPTEHFIKYEVEWLPDAITFRVNGKTVRTCGYGVASHLQNTKQHVVFDLWTTGLDYTFETPMMIRNFKYEQA